MGDELFGFECSGTGRVIYLCPVCKSTVQGKGGEPRAQKWQKNKELQVLKAKRDSAKPGETSDLGELNTSEIHQ